MFDYLTPRLFKPLGIQGADWETDNKGINTGGWGLRVKTEDMAKFGQLFLQEGKWKRKRVLPKSWVKEASTVKISAAPGYTRRRKEIRAIGSRVTATRCGAVKTTRIAVMAHSDNIYL